jgi:two-component system, OmpR family, alkaline phosphatase synthesis response regulator PhoP
MTKILVVEDDPDLIFVTTKMLVQEGFETLAAENGNIGLEMAIKEHPDLILADVMMPELDGYQLLSSLRDRVETALTPFIFLTAKSLRSDRIDAMNLGADDYLTKPFTKEELISTVNAQLNKHHKAIQHYFSKNKQYQELLNQVENLQSFRRTRDEIFNKFSIDLRQTITKINLAVRVLQNLPDGAARDRHLEILQQECEEDIKLLNEVEHLHKFLTPENVSFLKQYNLLNK